MHKKIHILLFYIKEVIQMRICLEQNGSFQVKVTPNSHKKLYMVEKDGKKSWMVFSDVVKEISLGNVENAKVYKNNIVFVKPDLRVEKMDNKNIIKLKKHLNNYLNDYVSEQGYDCFDETDYSLVEFEQSLHKIEPKNYKNYIIGYKGNEIVSVYYISKNTFGIPFIYNIYIRNYDLIIKFCNLISTVMDNSVFYFDYLNVENIDKYGYKFINLSSKINKNYRYVLSSGCYITRGNANILIDKIEEKYLPQLLDIRQVVIKRLKTKDIQVYLENYNTGEFEGTWVNDCNMSSVVGFHYFTYRDVFSGEPEKDYLVALYKGQIIGIMKYGLWGNEQSVAYIDVLNTCRNKGIATLMIKALDKHLYPMYELHLTDESELGHKCGMAKLFKKHIKSTVVKDYEDLRGYH